MPSSPVADFRPARLPLKFRRGDKVTLPITHKEGGVQVMASTRQYRAQIRTDEDAETTVAEFDIDTSTDIVVCTLADTATLEGEYVWDLEDVTNGRTLIAGPVDVEADVSRA